VRKPRLVLLSMEPWDEVWRRNQHLVAALVEGRFVDHVTFVEPSSRLGVVARRQPMPRVTVVRPAKHVPDRWGGRREVGRWIGRNLLADADLLWVNDATVGRYVAHDRPVLHDVTDDWRLIPQPADALARLVAGEDMLARVATVVVCSPTLQERWKQRYGLTPDLVPNAVSARHWRGTEVMRLAGAGPHVLYIGTLHADRLDVDLVTPVAQLPEVGTVHLVGPDLLTEPLRHVLTGAGVRLPGPVNAAAVPGLMRGADLLMLPHRVDGFTLSLDAIKAYEYMASGRPVVATPTSGFQNLRESGMLVVDAEGFCAAVRSVLRRERSAVSTLAAPTWDQRAAAMSTIIERTIASYARPS
jgi:glycosyltransferase involved in cell wall biosynthesis